MTATRRILITSAIVLCSAACGTSSPTAPGALASVVPTTLAANESGGVSCTVDVGATAHQLPAFHVYVNWLRASTASSGSDLTCGQVNSLDAKMELLAKALDTNPPAFETACGTSIAAAREIDALTNAGKLAVLTFPPPIPGGPTTLEQIAEELSETWCAAARGDLTGPRS